MASCEVAIAVINYNTRTWLASCLDSIFKAPPLASFEVFLVDNASTDGSVDLVKENYSSVHIIENAGNLGYSGAANQAIRTSEAKYVFVLNTDTVLDPEAIDILVEFGDAHEDMGVAGPMLLNTDGTIQISGRHFPSLMDATAHAFLGIIWPTNPFSVRYQMLDWDRQSQRSVDWVSGAAMFIRKDAAQKVGFFDERFFMYVEDMDICYRMWQDGFKVYFCPDAKVTHHLAKSSVQSSARMIIEFQRSLYRFFTKIYRHTWKWLLSPVVAVGLALRAGILIVLDSIRVVVEKRKNSKMEK